MPARLYHFRCGYTQPEVIGGDPGRGEELLLAVDQIVLIALPPLGAVADKGGWYGRIVMSSGYTIEGVWADRRAWLGLVAAADRGRP